MKSAAAGLAALLLLVVGAIGAMASLFGTSGQQDTPPGGVSSAVPAQYLPWVQRAGSMCPQISPALVAAQIDAESGWDPKAVSPAGAKGLSQFMDGTFPTWGKDDDKNGTASQLDPGDAIMAQGRFDCWNVNRLKGGATGDHLIELVLAAYNAGPYSVLAASCTTANHTSCRPRVPQIPETLRYIDHIFDLLAKYAAPAGPADAAGGQAGWVPPISGPYSVGATFHQLGPAWRMLGWHTGYDYAVPVGTNVLAAAAGTVVHAANGATPGGTGAAYGNQIIIDHGPDAHGYQVRSYYDHLSAFAVKNGEQVRAGHVIGAVGLTGNTFGPHVHVEVTVKNPANKAGMYFVDPHQYIATHKAPPAKPASTTADATNAAGPVITAAKSQLGQPYSLGGGTLTAPSPGFDGRTGWDCSSFVRYAWYQGSHHRTQLPRTTWDQADKLDHIPTAQIQPGDLIFFQAGGQGGWDHVGIYLGDGKMIHAPNPQKTVEIVNINTGYYKNLNQTVRRVQ